MKVRAEIYFGVDDGIGLATVRLPDDDIEITCGSGTQIGSACEALRAALCRLAERREAKERGE